MLKGERAGYGEQIVSTLARQLEAEPGRGFSAKNLCHMLRFAEVIETEEIVYALSRQLSWTHLRSLIYIDDPLKRNFYLEMCRSEGRSTRSLQGRLDSMLFERTALSRLHSSFCSRLFTPSSLRALFLANHRNRYSVINQL